ncbi:hypothetical protein DFH28DRAFT_904067 [Melampsora americana]|nr:hypothetical protein DFH28DRAFT_904067 [Melampsora americana]
MGSHRIIHGFNTRSKQPKATTPRQREYLAQQARELEQCEKANTALQKRLAQRKQCHPPPPGYNGPFEYPNYPDQPELGNDPEGAEDNVDDRNHYVIDPNEFMPRPAANPNQPEDPIIPGLRREQHLQNRLIHEERWAWQYAIMLPTFLRCRLLTANWGDWSKWNTDFREPCNCPNQTEREVDLVDILSRQRVKITFCKRCDPSDMVRLLLMGYIGASPVHPATAFSVRLMVHHHAMWLRCAVPTQDWHVPFTAAIDTYRATLLQIRTLEQQKLQLSDLGILAANCPKCFGPPVGVTRPEEGDVTICLDGNYQHRRHASASVIIPGSQPPRPELFLETKAVNEMARQMNCSAVRDGEDGKCTEAHKTAEDVRGKSYFKSMDESGLIGMACRHDHVLRYINLIQSGEKSYYALALIKWLLDTLAKHRVHTNKVNVLYDIGCVLDKTIKKVSG